MRNHFPNTDRNSIAEAFTRFAKNPVPNSAFPLIFSIQQKNYLDFLTVLRFEAQDILNEGDTLIPETEIPFGQSEHKILYVAVLSLNILLNKKRLHEESPAYLQRLFPALKNIGNYYSTKLHASWEAKEKIMQERETLVKKENFLRAQGTKGIRQIFEIDNLDSDFKSSCRPDGTIDFARAAGALEEVDEIRKIYAADTDPALLGRSPAMIKLDQQAEAFLSNSQRSAKVVKELGKILINLERTYQTLNWPLDCLLEMPESAQVIAFPCDENKRLG